MNTDIQKKLKELILGYEHKIADLNKENVHIKLSEDWFKNMIHSNSLNDALKVGFLQEIIEKITLFSKNHPLNNQFEKIKNHANHTEKLEKFGVLKTDINTKIKEIEKNITYLSENSKTLPAVLFYSVQKLINILNQNTEQLKSLTQKIQKQETKKPNLFNKIEEKFKKFIPLAYRYFVSKGNNLPILSHPQGANSLLNKTLEEGKKPKTARHQNPNYNEQTGKKG